MITKYIKRGDVFFSYINIFSANHDDREIKKTLSPAPVGYIYGRFGWTKSGQGTNHRSWKNLCGHNSKGLFSTVQYLSKFHLQIWQPKRYKAILIS